jgi:GNAT superfamily N-acetyltransferase
VEPFRSSEKRNPDDAVSAFSLSYDATMHDLRVSEEAAPGLGLRQVPIGDPDAQALIELVQEEYVVRYGGRDESPIDHAQFLQPRGSFFVGRLDGRPVVSGAWRRRSDVEFAGTTNTAEIKRMYVVPAARGLGLARRMLAHLEATARDAGVRAMVLETGLRQPEAIALYETSGYVAIPPFGFYRDSDVNRCFAKSVGFPACPADTPYVQ